MSSSDARGRRLVSAERRRKRMVIAIVSVALFSASVLFLGTRIFGTTTEEEFPVAQIGIGVTAEATRGDLAAPGTTDPSDPVSTDSSALTAMQPAVPDPSTAEASPTPATTAPTTQATKTATTTVQTGNTSLEAQVIVLVNEERATAGCSAVTEDSRLTAAARGHSSDMATRDYFSHDTLGGGGFADRITAQGYTWSRAGENIAMGQATAAQVMEAWMNSSGHRANILNCDFEEIGVGLAYNSSKTPYWTQDFATPS